MTPTTAGPHVVERRWPALGAAVWSAVFAWFHIVWALGWYVGLDAEATREAFQTTWKLMFDIGIAGCCVLGVWLGWAYAYPPGRPLADQVAVVLGWCATSVLVLRSGGSIVQSLYYIFTGRGSSLIDASRFWEFWFYLGTTLFCVSFWQFQRAHRGSGRPPS